MVPLLEHATGLFKGRLNCHGPFPAGPARTNLLLLLAWAYTSQRWCPQRLGPGGTYGSFLEYVYITGARRCKTTYSLAW